MLLKLAPSSLKGKSDTCCVRAAEPGLCSSATQSPLLNPTSALICTHWGGSSLRWVRLPGFCVQTGPVGIALWPWAPFLSPSSPQLEGSEQGPQAVRNSVNPAIARSHTGVCFAQISSSFPRQPEIVPGTRPKGDQGRTLAVSTLVPCFSGLQPTEAATFSQQVPLSSPLYGPYITWTSLVPVMTLSRTWVNISWLHWHGNYRDSVPYPPS